MKDEHLLEAFNAWQDISQTPDTVIAYHSRLKAIINKEALLADAKNSGIEEKGKEVTRKIIAKGFNNEEIMDLTDLTAEQIEALRNEG